MAAESAPVLQAMGELDRRVIGDRKRRPGVFLRLIEFDKRDSAWKVVAEVLTSEDPPAGIQLTGTVRLSAQGNRSQWLERPLSKAKAFGLAESLTHPSDFVRRVPLDAPGLHLLERLSALMQDPLVQIDEDDRVALRAEIEACGLEFAARRIISVSRAAELAHVSLNDLRKRASSRANRIGFGPETVRDLRDELAGAGVVLGSKESDEE